MFLQEDDEVALFHIVCHGICPLVYIFIKALSVVAQERFQFLFIKGSVVQLFIWSM